jgi:hypothetical protein
MDGEYTVNGAAFSSADSFKVKLCQDYVLNFVPRPDQKDNKNNGKASTI